MDGASVFQKGVRSDDLFLSTSGGSEDEVKNEAPPAYLTESFSDVYMRVSMEKCKCVEGNSPLEMKRLKNV